MENIIFDVDGTLWDTTDIVARAWNRAVSEVGITAVNITADLLKTQFGKTMDVIAKNLFPDVDWQLRKLLLEKCCEYEHVALMENTDNLMYPGVRETIEKLSEKCNLFIVSNCQCGYIELFMEKAGVEKFITDHECFGNTNKSKGENIRLLMERNNLKEAVYVGDTQGDYEATVVAGVPFIFASYGFGEVENFYRAIDGFEELLNLY